MKTNGYTDIIAAVMAVVTGTVCIVTALMVTTDIYGLLMAGVLGVSAALVLYECIQDMQSIKKRK